MTAIRKNWLEWGVFAVSLALLAGVLGFLAYDAATGSSREAELEVSLGEPERRGAGFGVPVRVSNRGGQTAEGVHVEVVLRHGAGEERGQFVVAFVPRGSSREGFVNFTTDPRGGSLDARVLGYEKP
ncbi:MAG TPA: hypothetical protein VEY09_02920 [Pyrinomonadaceae bacterium]|nr:hypothetical protein [Pyrinomonadaceae bacterium]